MYGPVVLDPPLLTAIGGGEHCEQTLKSAQPLQEVPSVLEACFDVEP